MKISRPLTPAALALVTILTVSGCSSSNEKSPEGDPTTTSASPSPTAPAVPEDWQAVDLRQVAELHIPSDWTIDSTNTSLQTLEAPKDATGFPPGRGGISVGSLAGGDEAEQLEWVAKHAQENDYSGYTNFKRLPDEVINETPFFRFQFESDAVWWDVYGTVTPDGEHSILIEWQFDKTTGRKQAEAIWSPVMPTFKML